MKDNAVFSLTNEAAYRTNKNFKWVVAYARPVLLYVFVIELLQSALPYIFGVNRFSAQGLVIVSIGAVAMLQFVSFYFYALFNMSWFKGVILGFKGEHKMRPFSLSRSEKKYVFLFVSVLFMLLLPIFLYGGVLLYFVKIHMVKWLLALFVLLGLYIGFKIVLISMRYMFLFAGRAVGDDVTYGQAVEMARGKLVKLFFSSILVILIPSIIAYFAPVFLYDLIGKPFAGVFGSTYLVAVKVAIDTVLNTFFGFYLTALNLSVVSLLYMSAKKTAGDAEVGVA